MIPFQLMVYYVMPLALFSNGFYEEVLCLLLAGNTNIAEAIRASHANRELIRDYLK